MMYRIDLSGDRFHSIYFNESIVAFRMPDRFGPSLAMLVWGATLCDPDPALQEHLSARLKEEGQSSLYLSGWGVLTFEGVKDGAATLAVYESKFPPENSGLLRYDGTPVTLHKPWLAVPSSEQPTYCLEAYLEVPFGHLTLDVIADGAVYFTLDPNRLITTKMFSQSPHEFMFDRFRERQLMAELNS